MEHKSSDSDNEVILLKECEHYNRGCHLLFPCCNKFYSCRFCHNDENSLDHDAQRKTVIKMKCRYCLEEQNIGDTCTKCQQKMGNYFCMECKLLDLDDKGQYHCNKCGICRIGHAENFVHCDGCGLCISKISENNHKCMNADNVCPICRENMFESINEITKIKCGHWIHIDCMKSYINISHSYECPLCSKRMFDMTDYDEYIEQQINAFQMPDEYKDKEVEIICNECNKLSNAKFHFYGHKCTNCGSFNTKLS